MGNIRLFCRGVLKKIDPYKTFCWSQLAGLVSVLLLISIVGMAAKRRKKHRNQHSDLLRIRYCCSNHESMRCVYHAHCFYLYGPATFDTASNFIPCHLLEIQD